jgi:hypothetical protein
MIEAASFLITWYPPVRLFYSIVYLFTVWRPLPSRMWYIHWDGMLPMLWRKNASSIIFPWRWRHASPFETFLIFVTWHQIQEWQWTSQLPPWKSRNLLNNTLFSDTVHSKHHTVSDPKMNNEKLTGSNAEGGGCSLIWGTSPAYSCRN